MKALLQVSIFVALFGPALNAHAVVNGVNVDSRQRPEIGLLMLNDGQMPARCTGVFISDSQMLTAGHCINTDQGPISSVWYYGWNADGSQRKVQSLSVKTNYIYETITAPETTGPVPGCSPGLKPLPQTKTADVALITFPKNTATKWAPLDLNYTPHVGDQLEFAGFGGTSDPTTSQNLSLPPASDQLNVGTTSLWRFNSQRIASVTASLLKPYAIDGDSGSPVFFQGKLIAIMNTVGIRCDTELGDDYAFMNTATVLNSAIIDSLK